MEETSADLGPGHCSIFIESCQQKLLPKGVVRVGSIWQLPQGFPGKGLVEGGREVREGSSPPPLVHQAKPGGQRMSRFPGELHAALECG